MLNQVIILGKIKSIEESSMVITVSRSYKDEHGEYGSDDLPVDLSENMMHNVKEYCSVGDFVSVKGSLRNVHNHVIINGEKLTFLASKSPEGKEGETHE